MSNFYQELDLERTLQCPVCMELPEGIIYECKVGHNICAKCRRKLTSCPSCQSDIKNTRNFCAEEIIAKLSTFRDEKCEIAFGANKDNEKTVETNLEELKPLKPLRLPAGIFSCVLQSCQNNKKMGVGDMYTHIGRKHPRLFFKFPNESSTFEHNFDDFFFKRSQRNYNRAMYISNMGLFFLIVTFTPNRCMNCCVIRPAPICQSHWFNYVLEFVNQGEHTRLQFADKVTSTLREKKWLLEQGKVWVVPPKTHNLEIGLSFSLRVKIVYNKPSE